MWETIGGRVFETCVRSLGIKSRLVIVGGISGYKEDKKEALPKTDLTSLPEMVKIYIFHNKNIVTFQTLFSQISPSLFKRYLVLNIIPILVRNETEQKCLFYCC